LANTPPFDLIFIDADKPNNPHYLEMRSFSPARRIFWRATPACVGSASRVISFPSAGSDGKLITLEADPTHAGVARQNIRLAGLNERIELIEGY
jgi:predicted O-methyltransferase YrrM